MTNLELRLTKAKPILLEALRRTNTDFSFYLVNNKEMEEIRRSLITREDFKGREAKKIAVEDMVNVLAFPEPDSFPHPETGKKMLGEVYLNRDFLPAGFGKTKAGSLDRYEVLGPLFIHGFLHLSGYHHSAKRDTIKMQNLEKKLWAELMSRI